MKVLVWILVGYCFNITYKWFMKVSEPEIGFRACKSRWKMFLWYVKFKCGKDMLK